MEPEDFPSRIQRYLPLAIERAEFSNENLSLGDPTWSFTSTSPWRLVSADRLVAGAYSDNSYVEIARLPGRRIVRVAFQRRSSSLDPSFEVDNGMILEVFSCHPLEPWVLRLPEGPVLVASPSGGRAA